MIDWISCQNWIPDKNWNARCSRIPRDSFLSVDVTHLWALRPEGLIRVTTKTAKSARKLFGALPTRVWPLHPTKKIKQFFSDIYHMTSRARWPRPFNALRWKSFPRSWVSKTQKKLYKVETEILLENSGDNPMSQKVRIWLKIFIRFSSFTF